MLDLSDADRVLKDLYGPAVEQMLRDDLPLFNMISLGSRPVYVPVPKWKWFLRTARERLNSSYMHLRYGECDDLKEWDEHIC